MSSRNRIPFINFILILSVHGIIILISIIPDIRGQELMKSITEGDQITYVNAAHSIINNHSFSREQKAPFLWEPYRTPGFPILLAFSLLITKSIIPVLFINALMAATAGYFGTKLLQYMNSGASAQIYLGIIFAILPNALGLNCLLLTDSLFGYLNLIWIYFLYIGLKENNKDKLLVSALILILAQLIKPTLSVAPILIVPIAFFIFWGKFKEIKFKPLGLILALSLITPASLSLMNFQSHGIFTPSLLGEVTKREYLIAKVISDKTGISYTDVQRKIRSEDELESQSLTGASLSFYGKLYTIKKTKSDSIIKENKLIVLKNASIEFLKQCISPQEYIFSIFIAQMSGTVRTIGIIINLIFFALIINGYLQCAKLGNSSFVLTSVLFFAFYLSTGSLSSYQGARLRFPADIIAIPIAAIGLTKLNKLKKDA